MFFLFEKGLSARDIHKGMFPVYGGKCLLHKVFHNWVKKFSQERLKVTDDARPGHPIETATEGDVQ
jgi:hypothetical protein